MKSKSDIKKAYEAKEVKYRREINRMKDKMRGYDDEVDRLNLRVSELEEQVRQRDDWINRLLEYMDLSETDLQAFIERTKDVERLSKVVNDIAGLADCFSYLISGKIL